MRSSESICWRRASIASSSSVRRSPFEVAVEHLAVLNHHDRFAVEEWSQSAEAEAEVGDEHGHQRDRADGECHPGHGVVALGDALLDQVAEDDEQGSFPKRCKLAPTVNKSVLTANRSAPRCRRSGLTWRPGNSPTSATVSKPRRTRFESRSRTGPATNSVCLSPAPRAL